MRIKLALELTNSIREKLEAFLKAEGVDYQVLSDKDQIGNTTVRAEFRYIEVEGRSHQLPAKEFHLLKHLAQNPGRVFGRDELLDLVWGLETAADTNVLEVTVSNLRKRLDKLGSDLKIRNSRNLGYWVEN